MDHSRCIAGLPPVLLAYRVLVVQFLHGPEEVQALGGTEFALLHHRRGQRVQDFLQQVHLARVGGGDVEVQRVGIIAVLYVRTDVPAVL